MNYITVEHLPKEFQHNHTRRSIPKTFELYFDNKGGAYIGENIEFSSLKGLTDIHYCFHRAYSKYTTNHVDSLVHGEHAFVLYEAFCCGKSVSRESCPRESNEWVVEITNIEGELKYFIHESISSDIVLEQRYPNDTDCH